MFDVLLILVSISLFGYAFFKWATKNDNYFKDRNLAYMKPQFLFGNMGAFMMKRQTAKEFSDSLYNAHPTKKYENRFTLSLSLSLHFNV